MRSKNQITLVLLMLVVLFIGLYLGKYIEASSKPLGYFPSFKIIGDVEEIVTISYNHNFPLYKMEHKEVIMDFISLVDIIKAAEPIADDFEVLLVGNDGLISKIDEIQDCGITFSSLNGWEFVNKYHPISSNIKMVKEIVIVSKEGNWEEGLNIINTVENILNITAGQFYLQGYDVLHNFEGTATAAKNGMDNSSTVYTTKKVKKLKDLIDIPPDSRLLAMGAKGDYGYVDANGYIELIGNQMNFLNNNSKEMIEDVKGIFMNPPIVSNMDTYYDTLHFLDKNERVLIFLIDGFGYHQYIEGMNSGYTPFLKSQPQAQKASTVYKPVTNAGFAATITGEPPSVNGVYSREQRELKVPSIFATALNLDKKAALIQGPINVLNTEIEPILNIDSNNSGLVDDEVYERTLKEINNGYHLILVHFKGLDTHGHSTGDLSRETMNMLQTLDKYIEDISNKWEGKIIITSDHGMHSKGQIGSHGAFIMEDMMVPYLVIEGGLANE
ncbi:hypothetical protein F8154_13135 [Alkaliphilus pronyensis]|uniref:Metalloenzyme domain-containing protein n=1 Tax=Alkaliphilus pronyensis TaxID=1482732 RepID=A0A6I0EW85_9FIRM|nr:alkaline phosphatase family protein [Alkaliphilus pronyensis]KAB3531270.1 hypothetical protein F8154_13135 [Alkaliphilus pronyensis]